MRQLTLPITRTRLVTDTFHKTTFPTIPPASDEHQTRIISLLQTRCINLTQLKQVHARIYQFGLHQSSYVLTKLIRTLTRLKIPMHSYSYTVFRNAQSPNDFLWTAMIRGHVVNGEMIDALFLYTCMKNSNVRPNSFTFCTLLNGCSGLDSGSGLSLGRQLHGQMIKVGGLGMELFLNAGNKLIDLYVKCQVLGCARKVFDEMPVRDLVSMTSLIVGYAKAGEVDDGRKLFDELSQKDKFIWTAMITAYAQNARPKECLELFEIMQNSGVIPDEFTLASVISACAQLGTSNYATKIQKIAESLRNTRDTDVEIGSALIDMLSKCGKVDEAFEIFQAMRERNVYSYSSMILGFAINGRANDAIQLFYHMENTNIKPNHVTFIGILTACSHAGLVEQGRQLFKTMEEKYGIKPDTNHYTCMVDLLGRSGHLEEALDLANSLHSHPHGGVWGALLGACNIHKNPEIGEIAAEHLFEMEPNIVANYVLLFNILASSGKWERASKVQTLMKEKGLKKYPACSWVEGKTGVVHEFFSGDFTHPRSNEIKRVLEDLLNKLMLRGYQPKLGLVSYDISEDDKREMLMDHSEKLALGFKLLTSGRDHVIRIMKNLRICEDCHVFMCGVSEITEREIIVRDNMRFHHFRDGVCSCGNFW